MRRPDESGMALLVVLLLVAVMSALAVSVLDDIRFAQRRTLNAEAVDQARWYAIGAETLVAVQARRMALLDPTSSAAGEWSGRVFRFPVEEGAIQARLSPGADCFNLNSVVQGYGEVLKPRDAGRRQFIALLTALKTGTGEAEALAAALTDWIDSDQIRQSGGAEDEAYARGPRPYRTAGTLVAEVSELRAVRGFTPDVYRRIRPYVCALPTSDLSPINVNTLSADKAVLLVMLTDGALSLDQARQVIAGRPGGGWSDAAAFWQSEGMFAAMERMASLELTGGGAAAGRTDSLNAVFNQVALRPRYLTLDTEVAYRGAEVVSSVLFEIDPAGEPRLAARRWTRDE
ncbi:MAG: type II secretion system minor pseudopilin GspK [Phenylobacterium sp.]|uniref:type II secretion system minor pseudopilin GspK n=1 Tax=Phenylobacterium sp. TaxID=1871053 RepID=UPI0039190242